jgi:hypothetical protein
MIVAEINRQIVQIAGYTDLSLYPLNPASTMTEVLFTYTQILKKAFVNGINLGG